MSKLKQVLMAMGPKAAAMGEEGLVKGAGAAGYAGGALKRLAEKHPNIASILGGSVAGAAADKMIGSHDDDGDQDPDDMSYEELMAALAKKKKSGGM